MTISYWNALPKSASVAVLGGGITGASVAYWLARAGVECVLLERGELACGASGRNDGQSLVQFAEFYNRLVNALNRDRARRLIRFRRANQTLLVDFIGQSGLKCDYKPGTVTLAMQEHELKELRQDLDLFRSDGVDVQWLDAGGAKEASKSAQFLGGLYFGGDFTVNPYRLTRGIAAEAEQLGAVIAEHHPVTSVAGNRVEGPWGALQFDVVVFATNAYTPQFFPAMKEYLWPVRGQIVATVPLGLHLQYGCQTNYGYDYWKTTPDGRLVIGGRRFVDEHGEYTDQEGRNPKIRKALEEFMMKLYGIAPEKIEHEWSGIMCFSKDALPLIGSLPGRPGMFIAAGYTGYGLSYAFQAGRCVAEMIAGQQPSIDCSLFSPARLVQ